MPGRKGTVSGFIVAGFGAGAAVFNIVATATVNPHNVSPDPSTGFYDEVGVPQHKLILTRVFFSRVCCTRGTMYVYLTVYQVRSS